MSTKSSIWYAESEGKTVHIYWELGERVVSDGKMIAAPIYLAVQHELNLVAARLPKEVAEAILSVLQPNGDSSPNVV
jgi:hypothetical protein